MKHIDAIHLRSLSSAIVLAFGASSVHAACLGGAVVTNCADSGVGSLRSVVGCAETGQIVSMQNLTCSEISLTTGAIQIQQNDLELDGSGVVVTGRSNGNNRIFNHTGTGTLTLSGVTVTNATYKASAAGGEVAGGCIASAGNVALFFTSVTNCTLHGTGGTQAAGGGVFASSGLLVQYALVSGNTASGDGTGTQSYGGGLTTTGSARIYYSSISNNSAEEAGGLAAIVPTDYVVISNSTISANRATMLAGGAALAAKGIVIDESTISGNYAAFQGAGLVIGNSTTQINNSTIAFNVQKTEQTDSSAGLIFIAGALTMQSTIVSNNVVAGAANDMYVDTGVTLGGTDNLVYAFASDEGTPVPSNFGLPAGTCPLLAPLNANDSFKSYSTHALFSGSPALAHGNNLKNFTVDQRGSGFPRTSKGDFGLVFTDIGAYELQRADIVFNTGFDGCP